MMTVDELRCAANVSQQQAAAARELALDVERRRQWVVSRDDETRARHSPAAWSSHAATRSREELEGPIARSLGLVSDDLRETRYALEARAEALDNSARSYRRWADDTAARLELTGAGPTLA